MINIEQLLAPIDSTQPCGVDLRLSSDQDNLYHQLRECRNQARTLERKQGSEESALLYTQTNEYWNEILKLAPLGLTSKTKDLEIACWLLEAETRVNGLNGLANALDFLNQFVNRYWNDFYPSLDENGVEDRVSCIQGLNGYSNEGALIAPLYMLSIVNATSYEKISTWDYMQAKNIEKLADNKLKEERYKSGIKSLEKLQAQITSSDRDFYRDLLSTLKRVEQNLTELANSLDTLCGKHAPSLKNIKEALAQMQLAITSLTKAIFISDESSAAPETSPMRPESSTLIPSREAALRKLEEVAAYFYSQEPHSPISYAIRKILKWSHMDLVELIPELIRDPRAQFELSWILGLEVPEEKNTYSDQNNNLDYGGNQHG